MGKEKSETESIKIDDKNKEELNILKYANTEIERVRHVYLWLSGILGIIITVGIAIAAVITYNNVNDVRSDMRNESDRIAQMTKERLNIMTERVQLDMDKEVFKVERSIKEKIEDEFEVENIRNLIRNSVEEISEGFIQTNISESIIPIIEKLDNRINNLNNSLDEAQKLNYSNIEKTKNELAILIEETNQVLDTMRQISDVSMLISSAQSGNRTAWEKLFTLSNDKKYNFKLMTEKYYNKIKDEYSAPFYTFPKLSGNYLIKELYPGVDTLTLDVLANVYKNLNYKNENDNFHYYLVRLQLVNYIYEKKDFALRDKLNFLIEVIKSDLNLEVVAYAGKLFNEKTKSGLKPLAIKALIDHWEKNKAKY